MNNNIAAEGFVDNLKEAFVGRADVAGLFDVMAYQIASKKFIEDVEEQCYYFGLCLKLAATDVVDKFYKCSKSRIEDAFDESNPKVSDSFIKNYFENILRESGYVEIKLDSVSTSRKTITLADAGVKERRCLLKNRISALENAQAKYAELSKKQLKQIEECIKLVPKVCDKNYVSCIENSYRHSKKTLEDQIKSVEKSFKLLITEYDKNFSVVEAEYNKRFGKSKATEEFDLEEGMNLLSEFNDGCKAFENWVANLELSQIHNSTQDPALKQLTYSLAQENILTDTVTVIFKKIGEFIAWFWRKLKEIWNYFFGKTQRAVRQFDSNFQKMKQHKNSGKLVSKEAFINFKVPAGVPESPCILDTLDMWEPDQMSAILDFIYEQFEKNPVELLETYMHAAEASNKLNALPRITGQGIIKAPIKSLGEFIIKTYPGHGTLDESGYIDPSIVMHISEQMEKINASYSKNAKLISSKGDLGGVVSSRSMQYADRLDLTEHEAANYAKAIKDVAGMIQFTINSYQDTYSMLLNTSISLQEVYKKCMQ